ncbi:MAG: hypothetical protein HEQ32_06165 [Vampirovibrio sp.]
MQLQPYLGVSKNFPSLRSSFPSLRVGNLHCNNIVSTTGKFQAARQFQEKLTQLSSLCQHLQYLDPVSQRVPPAHLVGIKNKLKDLFHEVVAYLDKYPSLNSPSVQAILQQIPINLTSLN